MKKVYWIGILSILGFTALGELARLPIGPANGILPNDLLVGALVGIWLIDKVALKRKVPESKLWVPFASFIAIAVISLINGTRWLNGREVVESAIYLVRLFEVMMLMFIVVDLKQEHSKIFRGIVGTTVLLGALGFLQLKFFPDFTTLAEEGWDPHINRLLSTWFDPNFVGGLFAFTLSLIMAKLVIEKLSLRWMGLGAVILLALFLTYSRSAYLAFLIPLGIISVLKSHKLLIVGLIAGLLLISVSERALERVTNLVYSATAVLEEQPTELPDATARLRLDSWDAALQIIEKHPLLGVGYNAYRSTQLRYGFIDDPNHHAATGSDSTLLTLWATTGLLGLTAYLWLLGTILWITFKNRNHAIALGTFAGIGGLLVHSIFVNSLLYTPLLTLIMLTVGLATSTGKPVQKALK